MPQLTFDSAEDHMGSAGCQSLYGTGKSHLISVRKKLAEDAAYVPMIRHPRVADAAAADRR